VRKYLLTIVFRPGAKQDEVAAGIQEVLGETEGKVQAEEDLPIKRLAYPISGHLDGSFHQMHLSGSSELPRRLTELLRIQDEVIRFLIVAEKEQKVKKES
jgi:ribosomal protein S6